MTGLRYIRHRLLGIMNDQRISLRQQGRRARLIGPRVPNHASGLFERCVGGERVGCLVGGASDQDVNLIRGDGEGGVVPGEGDGVDADLVKGGCGERGGRDHVYTARR